MERSMKLVETYRGYEIKYIDFAKWYVVFFPKKRGNVEMKHCLSLEDAQTRIDEYILSKNYGQYSIEDLIL